MCANKVIQYFLKINGNIWFWFRLWEYYYLFSSKNVYLAVNNHRINFVKQINNPCKHCTYIFLDSTLNKKMTETIKHRRSRILAPYIKSLKTNMGSSFLLWHHNLLNSDCVGGLVSLTFSSQPELPIEFTLLLQSPWQVLFVCLSSWDS